MKKKNQGCANVFLVLVFLGLVMLPGKSFAAGLEIGAGSKNIRIVLARDAIGVLMANAYPASPMLEGMTELRIAPGVFSFKCDRDYTENQCENQSEDGQGIVVSLIHAYTPHFGVALMGAYLKSSGTVGATDPSAQWGEINAKKYTGPVEENGEMATLSVILDPFSDPDGFRLPFAFGLSYQNISGMWDVPFFFDSMLGRTSDPNYTRAGDRGQDTGDFSMNTFGVYGGFSVQFNTGPFRWAPFEFGSYNFINPEYRWTVKNLDRGTSGTVTKKSGTDVIYGMGIPVTYRPWGLSFNYVFEFPGSTNGGTFTSYVLSWSKKW